MEQIPNKVRVSKDEMIAYFIKHRPFVPTHRRVGAYAKYLGYVRKTQMIQGQTYVFYIKKDALEGGMV